MHELEPSRESNNQEPFVIRAHHLPTFRNLLRRSDYGGFLYSLEPVLSPKELAEQVRSAAENCKLNHPGVEDYSIDVLGISPQTASRNTEQLQKTFETFLSLPDNHPVDITEGIEDDICKACEIGAHCKMKYPNGIGYKEDRRDLYSFVKAIDYIYSRKPSVSKEKVYFLDAEKPQKVRKVTTTMGVVRNVLATRPFELSDIHYSFWENLKLLWY